ncbi:MAG: LamG-like jellyroll fold domain-containing protein, partial [Clostridia bacterium]
MKKFVSAIIGAAAVFFALTAGAADVGEYFFVNNIHNDARFIEMKMLGAHDAFTASLNADSPVDEAGKKLGDSGSSWGAIFWGDSMVATSKAQSAHVEELLNSGVRYFDVRLSRYQSGGEFYTTHGRISDQFTGEGGIARKISEWAAGHPGEIIVLDFQSLFDIQTDTGGATQQSWKDLMTKLTQDGITDYVYTTNGSIIDLTYGSLTNNGSRAAIVLFGQVTGSWADSRYINRRDDDGYMRSLWTETTSYEKMYARLSEEIDNIRGNTETYYYKFRVMQAQTTASPLIGKANENNIQILTDENYDTWMEILPVLMVDNATTDEGNFNAMALDKLAKANRASAGGKYVSTSGIATLSGSNDNVPLGTKFTAVKSGNSLSLSLSEGDITGEMTVSLAPSAKRRRVYDESGALLAETAADGSLEFTVTSLGTYTIEELEESSPFAVTKPMLWYNFTDGNQLKDLSGNGFDASAQGSPQIGGGYANLSPGNVIKLPAGLTRNMKNYTVSSWVYVNSPVNGSRLFDIGRGARGSVFARVSSGDTSAGYKNTDTKQAVGSAVTAGKWVHVANTYNSADKTLSLYIDGKLISTQAASENPTPDSIN